tara:strand:+ start:3606 stop:4973 length:1368 start_codon:yes stop_codon:yes gene_type:complete
MKSIKKNILVILIGLIFSILFSAYSINKFDIYEISTDDKQYHSMIKGVNANHWIKAKKIKDQLSQGKNYFETGEIYDRNYLPSKIFLLYSYLSGDDLVESQKKNKIVTDNKKVLFLIFQSVLYYLSLFFFSLRLLNLIKPIQVFCVISFLSLEPTLLQWHSSFWSESIFMSLQLLFFAMLLTKNLNNRDLIIGGLILGLMFLQRSATIYYIFPILIFLYFSIKDQKLRKISFFLTSYLIVILFVGIHNLKRSGVFYLAPTDQKLAIKIYMMPKVMSLKENISTPVAKEKIDKEINNFQEKKNFKLDNEDELIKYYKMIQSYSYKYIFQNPIETTKFIFKKSLHTAVLDPVHVIYFHKFEYKGKNRYLNSPEHQFWIPIRIVYSLTIYFIVLIGFFALLKKDKKIFFLTFISTIYFFFILSWLGNPRYFTPCLIYLSLFFGFGLDKLIEILRFKKA